MKYPLKQYEVLQWASSFLKKHEREEQIAEVLLQHHLQLSRSAFFLHMRDEIAEHIWHAFYQDIEKHVKTGMPVQHIIGTAPFYGRDFHVNPAVLIPRFDTEMVIEQTLHRLQKHPTPSDLIVVDVGTGSGIIAVTLKLEMPDLTVYATDISEEALEVAKQNAVKFGADIQFLQGNFLEPIIQEQIKVNVIVSNPPYINYQDEKSLADTVKNYDPPLALYADDNGLASYRDIIRQSTSLHQNSLRHIVFEIGYDQSADVTEIARKTYPKSSLTTYQDLNGKDRVVTVNLK